MRGGKKVLIITYYWPPSGGGGVQRWLKFAKYLPQMGWEPIIYTPEDADYPLLDPSLAEEVGPEVQVIRHPIFEPRKVYSRLVGEKKPTQSDTPKGPSKDEIFFLDPKDRSWKQNLSLWIRGNVFIPDARATWIGPSIRFLTKRLKAEPVDAIISTGPPHSMHLIARGLHRKLGIPWVADFRDPWTEIEFYDRLMLTGWADKKHHKLERSVLQEANAVVVASGFWSQPYLERGAKRVEAITNGFDDLDFTDSRPPLSDTFLISHVGTFAYDRNPATFWRILKELCEEVPGFAEDLRLQMVGKTDPGIFTALEAAGLGEQSVDGGYVSHAEAIRIMQSSQLLLLLINQASYNAPGRIPGKIFEYFAAGRPIFSIGPPEGEPARIMRETGAGVTCDFEDAAGMKQEILRLYQSFKAGTLSVEASGIEAYSRKNLSQRMAALLKEIS